MPERSNFQLAARQNSARSPARFQPPRKQELCAAPEGPDAVLANGKVGEAEPGKARAREWICCGFLWTSGFPVPRAGQGCRPLPGSSGSKQVPQPLGRLGRRRALSPCCPAQPPARRPGLPPRSCPPGEESSGAEARTKQPRTPWHARCRRRRHCELLATETLAARVATRPQGAWEKPAPPCRAAAPHRAAPSSPDPRSCRPAA